MPASGKKILLVEDEQKIAKVYETALRFQSYEVVVSADGEKALNKLHKDNKFGLILLDLMLPVKNGMDVLREIKADPVLKNIPVILLTNLGQESLIKEALELGADEYFIKAEISPHMLIVEIEKLLNRDENPDS